MSLHVEKYVAGAQQMPTQSSMYHSRGGVSHQWLGPGFYLKFPKSRYSYFSEVYDPLAQRLDRNALRTHATSIEDCHMHSHRPLDQKWPGYPVFHSVDQQKLMPEHPITLIPRDARLFYNEEDWIKFKNMVNLPTIHGLPKLLKDPRKRSGKRVFPHLKDNGLYF